MVDTPPPPPPPPPPMMTRKIGMEDESRVTLAGRIMVGTIVAVFFLVVVILCLHIFSRVFWWRRSHVSSRRRRFVFTFSNNVHMASEGLRTGVDPSVMKHLPIVVFSRLHSKDALDCAVCLREVADGEKARILPNCSHGFHLGCIDMWLQSHSNCPLCRTSVGPQTSEQVMTSPHLLTNALFRGNEAMLASGRLEGTQGSLAIDIPSNNFCNEFSSSVIRSADQDEVRSQISSRLMSLTRLWTMSHQVAISSSSTDVDQEHGTLRIQAAP